MSTILPLPPQGRTFDERAMRSWAENIRNTLAAAGFSTITSDSGNVTSSTSVSVSILGGDGVDTTISGSTLTISAEDASTSNKGIASFNSTYFTALGGAVNLIPTAIDHNTLTNYVANQHIDWTSTTSNFSTSGTVATGALTVTGAIVVSTTVDGRDVSVDGTKLDGIESGATADLTQEEVQDFAWAAVSTGTQTGITVTYQDASNNVDFVVSDEFISDTVGAMVTGNTETNITVTYQDADNTLDFVVSDSFILNTGDIGTGVYDFGGADSFEIPNSVAPTVDVAGEIALDTTITDHKGLIKYYDGAGEMVVIAMPTANLGSTDATVVSYDAATDAFKMTAPAVTAPTSSQYVTLATDATLTNERVLTAGTAITVTDAGAGSTVTVAAVVATTTAQGVAELATAAETTTGTDTGRVIPVSALPIQIQDSKYVYAADAGSTDAYAITLAPAPAAYATGQVFHFKANTVNTGNATLNVNSLGAKNILKLNDTTLANGDIEAGQIVTVVYDGTQFQMQSQIANAAGGGGASAAIQSEQETGTSTTVYVSPGTQQYHASAAKCWGYITLSGGTPTLSASYNTTSITDAATGNEQITIATDMSSDNYSVSAAVIVTNGIQTNLYYSNIVATSFYLISRSAIAVDVDATKSYACFGDQ